jgi:uncharacterized protein with GYD domain
MATYIMLTKLTSDGVKSLKNNPGRVHEVNKEVEQIGVKVVNQWATLGEYDFVSVIEAPDEALRRDGLAGDGLERNPGRDPGRRVHEVALIARRP